MKGHTVWDNSPDIMRMEVGVDRNAQLSLSGRPMLSLSTVGLLSENKFHTMHHMAQANYTKMWRNFARRKAEKYIGWRDTPLVRRALVVVNVVVPHSGIMDVTNVRIKPIMDGFSDAGVYMDDEWAFVPIVLFAWAGIGAELLPMKRKGKRKVRARRTVIEVYELQLFKKNGFYQKLPRGRRRLE